MNLQRFTWPRFVAIVVLMAGALHYARNYPTRNAQANPDSGMEADTLISALGRLPRNEPGSGKSDASRFRNPFQSRAPSNAGPGAVHLKLPSPLRRWKLKGTAGNSVATVLDSAGVKHLMRVGDTLGGVRVLEVHPSRVSMQDEAGRFELELDK